MTSSHNVDINSYLADVKIIKYLTVFENTISLLVDLPITSQ